MITVLDLQRHVGAPAAPGATYLRQRGRHLIVAWEDAFAGEFGWWWAVTERTTILAMAWTAGSRRDRDRAIDVAIAVLDHWTAQGAVS